MKKFIIIGLILALVIFGYIIMAGPKTAVPQADNGLVLYYGETCPHCKIVEDYIAENNIKEKTGIVFKEVYQNKTNARELSERAKVCGLPSDQIGVPLLWDNGQCLAGDQPIIEYLKKK